MTQLALFDPQSVHLFRFDPSAVCIPPRGNPVGQKLRIGASRCVLCAVDAGMAAMWADCDCCRGVPRSAAPGALLVAAMEAA